MAENDTQSPSSQSASHGSTVNNLNNAGGTIKDSNINFNSTTYIISSPDDAKKALLTETKITLKNFEPETILIPTGPFMMGSAPGEGIPEYETPLHEVKDFPAYRIGKFLVTNKQYDVFMRKAKKSATEIGWKNQRIPAERENHPVTGVSWNDALAYCRWLNKETGRNYSLPNEAQWEKACRGRKFASESKVYPWGDEFNPELISKRELSAMDDKELAPQNDYDCFDFVGNVQQWTCSLWGTDWKKPDDDFNSVPWADDGRNDLDKPSIYWRVLKGSQFGSDNCFSRCSFKGGDSPGSRYPNVKYGFRVVLVIDEN